MNKSIAVALLVVGIVLIIWGVGASESFSSDVSRFFTGSPTDKTVWLMVVSSFIEFKSVFSGETLTETLHSAV